MRNAGRSTTEPGLSPAGFYSLTCPVPGGSEGKGLSVLDGEGHVARSYEKGPSGFYQLYHVEKF